MIPVLHNKGLLDIEASSGIFNTPQLYELRFTPVYEYEKELAIDNKWKAATITNIITYLANRNIFVTFTDRILDTSKPWENKGEPWRYLPIAELQGNNICINARNIDFLSIFLSIGHIYGHLVQRMYGDKYKPITDLIEMPKPLDLQQIFAQYRLQYGGDFKEDFKKFEIEAFRYAKFAFLQAGIPFTKELDYAMNIYIETDFNELWRWVSTSPSKSGPTFMNEFIRLYNNCKDQFQPLEPIPVEVNVITQADESLIVVRDGY